MEDRPLFFVYTRDGDIIKCVSDSSGAERDADCVEFSQDINAIEYMYVAEATALVSVLSGQSAGLKATNPDSGITYEVGFTDPSVIGQYNMPLTWFAGEMEKKLLKNTHKGGWEAMRPYELYSLLNKESVELYSALEALSTEWSLGRPVATEARDVIKECADVANFAMMLAERVNAIFLNMYEEGEQV